MSTHRSLAGVVLAGGYSTRFGEEDKAVADLAGTPMIRRVIDALAEVTDEVVVNCRDDQLEAIREAVADAEPTIRYAIDSVPDRGPLEGIRAGLEAATREYGAVVACDMPFVDPAVLELLAARAAGHDGAVVRLEDGWIQTTQAVYRREPMTAACVDLLESADGRIVSALERLDLVELDEDDLEGIPLETFESVDTQEALEAAEQRLRVE